MHKSPSPTSKLQNKFIQSRLFPHIISYVQDASKIRIPEKQCLVWVLKGTCKNKSNHWQSTTLIWIVCPLWCRSSWSRVFLYWMRLHQPLITRASILCRLSQMVAMLSIKGQWSKPFTTNLKELIMYCLLTSSKFSWWDEVDMRGPGVYEII